MTGIEWGFPFLVLLCIMALGMAAFALHHAFEARVEARALKESTHSIQFAPVDFARGRSDAELSRDIDDADEDHLTDPQRVHDDLTMPPRGYPL